GVGPGTATAAAMANDLATAQTVSTVIASAVEGTVTARIQGVASATALAAQATATPIPTVNSGSATPTAANASPTPSVAASTCPAQPVRGFGLLYSSNAPVAARLGCAVEGEVGTTSAVQIFDGGVMLEFGNSKQVLILLNAGATWSAIPDSYQAGKPLPTATVVPPAGRVAPVNAFGLAWQQQADARAQLGWPTGPEQQFPTGATELFAHGRMLWTPNLVDYVLFFDGTWQSYPDKFQG
ncbi:MAG TPA: hypothetical protein VKT80_10220, partial [Chloroflexota bacterium]|nr:hypothetical protein [Chloroflexota bacterium]